MTAAGPSGATRFGRRSRSDVRAARGGAGSRHRSPSRTTDGTLRTTSSQNILFLNIPDSDASWMIDCRNSIASSS
jgi:sulfite reductase beta subunit-like hemoprotein